MFGAKSKMMLGWLQKPLKMLRGDEDKSVLPVTVDDLLQFNPDVNSKLEQYLELESGP